MFWKVWNFRSRIGYTMQMSTTSPADFSSCQACRCTPAGYWASGRQKSLEIESSRAGGVPSGVIPIGYGPQAGLARKGFALRRTGQVPPSFHFFWCMCCTLCTGSCLDLHVIRTSFAAVCEQGWLVRKSKGTRRSRNVSL